MNTQVCHNVLQLLINELPESVARELLTRALSECETRSWHRMSELAENASRVARRQDDGVGQAAAFVFLGVASAQMKQFNLAADYCHRATRMFRRNPVWWHRLGEGLATYVLGLIHDADFLAIEHYGEALNLLNIAKDGYAAQGNPGKRDEIAGICEVLVQKISSQPLTVYINDQAFRVMVPRGQQEARLELKPNAEYRVVSVGKNKYREEYKESGLSVDDSILVRSIETVDEIVPGGLGIQYISDSEYVLGRFERDEQYRIRFIQPGTQPRVLGAADVYATGCVDAILKNLAADPGPDQD